MAWLLAIMADKPAKDKIMTTYALRAFQKAGTGDYAQKFILPGNAGAVVTGIDKLAERFVIELMTELGSLPYKTDRGTSFVTEAKAGQLVTEVDVFGAFALAINRLRINLNNEEAATDPLDECFSSAEIISLKLADGVLNLKITITSKSGATTGVIIPLTFNLFPEG